MVSDCTVTALGHATVALDVAGRRLLVDPVFGDAIGPSLAGRVMGPRRLVPKVFDAGAWERVDVLLLTHAHMDHLDLPTLARIDPGATAIVQRGLGGLVRRFHRRHQVSWWQTVSWPGAHQAVLHITSIPARHWGARMVVDRWRGWGGFLIEAPGVPSPFDPGRPVSIVVAGDTAYGEHYIELKRRRPDLGIDLAVMPIGAYDPWIHNHCTPEEAWIMAIEHLGAHRFMPVHYDTFRLSAEPPGEALRRLRGAAARRPDGPRRIVGVPYGTPVRLREAALAENREEKTRR